MKTLTIDDEKYLDSLIDFVGGDLHPGHNLECIRCIIGDLLESFKANYSQIISNNQSKPTQEETQ